MKAAAVKSDRTDRPILEVQDASRRFGSVIALARMSLVVPRGQFVTLLGPSGSGKTTLLRIIAGLEKPTEVKALKIAGADVRDTPANHRNVATVFQHYGLFPHMSVGTNVEYGLRVRGVAREPRKRRACEALAMVQLEDKYDRRIHQLSGGERQRVALARALVTEPDILLLDEPLAALDEKLRQEMQIELLRIHRELGTTFILVTHSQEEALTMSDRILLLNKGHLEQDGTPQDLFEMPASYFAARFIGIENVIVGRFEGVDGQQATLRTPGGQLVTGTVRQGASIPVGQDAFMAVRAERLALHASRPDAERSNVMECTSKLKVYKGKYYDLQLASPIGRLTGRVWDNHVGTETTYVSWQAQDAVIGPINTA